MVDDEALYHLFLNGDEDALRELLERHGNSLTYYLKGYTRDLNDAEDLMLEAFARMVVKKPRLDDGCFKGYLYQIGRNLALRHMAKLHRRRTFRPKNSRYEPIWVEPLEEVFLTQERDHILYLSMQQIQPNYREVLYLLYFENLSYRDAARVMHKNEKQIANLVYRGKQALRPILEKEGVTDAQY